VLGSDDVDEHVTVSGRRRVDEERVLHSLRRSAPLLREVLTGRTAVLACTADDLLGGRRARDAGTAAPPGTSASGEAYGSLIAVPLGSGAVRPGVLVTLREMGAATFEPAQVLLLASFADQAALALQLGERNRALRWHRRAGRARTYRRELHDTVMQTAVRHRTAAAEHRAADSRACRAGARAGRPWTALDQIVRDIRVWSSSGEPQTRGSRACRTGCPTSRWPAWRSDRVIFSTGVRR
jgi:hypothetical protein